MLRHLKNDNKTFLGIALLCLAYLFFQFWYIPYAANGADEFWFAHHIYQYTKQLPYRDFLPYKTILGYYLLTPAFFLSHDVLAPLYYIKDELAIINTLCIASVAVWATRFFKPKALFLTLILLLSNHLFLIYSVDLRVDMLTSWLGLIAALFVLSKRPMLAGVALALGFLISQKALWFWFSLNIALGAQWILLTRDKQTFRSLLLINATTLFFIGVYISTWALFSNWHTVLQSVFFEGYTQSKIVWYSAIYYLSWQMTLANGPLLIFLWPITLVSLLIYPKNDNLSQRLFIFLYASCICILILTFQQPFPYQTVYLVPAFFLLFCDFFSWFENLLQQNQHTLIYHASKRQLFWLTVFFTLIILSVIIMYNLPAGYLLTALIPSCLVILVFRQKIPILLPLCVATIFFTGIFYPLSRFSVIAYYLDATYQKSMIRLSHSLLASGGEFIAGIPFFYDQNQTILGLKNLIGPAIQYLHHPNSKLLPIMISSLYLEPRTSEQVIHDLQQTPVKLFINNYRIVSLPGTIRHYLYSNYLHYSGSIYIYAPTMTAGKQQFHLKFSGDYQLIKLKATKILVDHHAIPLNNRIKLSSGLHTSLSDASYRLKLIPPNSPKLFFPEENHDQWNLMLKAIVV